MQSSSARVGPSSKSAKYRCTLILYRWLIRFSIRLLSSNLASSAVCFSALTPPASRNAEAQTLQTWVTRNCMSQYGIPVGWVHYLAQHLGPHHPP